MLIDRPNIVEGSFIQNASIAFGTVPPSTPNIGELFFNTSLNQLQTFNGTIWETAVTGTQFTEHNADATKHLTVAQNTFLDGLSGTLTFTEVNYLEGTLSPVQTQLNTVSKAISDETLRAVEAEETLTESIDNISGETGALTLHLSSTSVHLNAAQNTFLDALNLPTLTAADVNAVPALAETLSTLNTSFGTHSSATDSHLSTAQKTTLDTFVAMSTIAISSLSDVTSPIQAQFTSVANNKLARDGSQAMTAALPMGGFRITALGTPTAGTDAATKDYVDAISQGLSWKETAAIGTTANIVLSGLQVIDGYSTLVNDRVLVKNQTVPAENGLYTASTGAWSRAVDANTLTEIEGLAVFVRGGTIQSTTAWVQTANISTFPGGDILFTQFAAAGGATGGNGISIVGSVISVKPGNGLTFSGTNLTLGVSTAFSLGTLLDLSNTGVANGTYRSVSVDTKGRVTSGTNPTTLAGYGISDAVPLAGGTMTGQLLNTSNINIDGSNFKVETSTKDINLFAFDVSRLGATIAGIRVNGTMLNTGMTTNGNASVSGTLTRNGNTVLDAGNYNNYSPKLDGTGATGASWNIGILGNSATVGGFTPSATSGTANRVVVADAAGYINNTYFNSSDNVESSGVTAVMVKTGGNNYLRSGTAQAIASFITDKTMNITGSATLNLLKTGGEMSGNISFSQAGLGIVGVYSDVLYQNVFSMGASYAPLANGSSLSNMYGIAWTHSNIGGQSKPGLSHQALFVEAGITKTAIGTGIWTAGGITTLGSLNVGTNQSLRWSDDKIIRRSTQSYGSIELNGVNNGYSGIAYLDAQGTVGGMFDTSGNGGDYDATTGWHFYWNRGNTCLGIGGSSTQAGYKAYVNGNLYATGDVTAFSDERVKTDIQIIPNALDKVDQLRGVTYTRTDNGDLKTGKRSTGVIAQDVLRVLPEAVAIDNDNPNGMMGVNYGNMVGLLIEAVKELRAEVKMLKAQLKS